MYHSIPALYLQVVWLLRTSILFCLHLLLLITTIAHQLHTWFVNPETQQFPAMSTIPIQRTHHRKTPPPPTPPAQNHKFIPISPPSSKSKSRSELLKSPPKHHHSTHNPRVCISCGSDQSPCWRPSWSIKEGQLCNSCGLRYKKTSARCLNKECKKIPAKGEWSLMQSKGSILLRMASKDIAVWSVAGELRLRNIKHRLDLEVRCLFCCG